MMETYLISLEEKNWAIVNTKYKVPNVIPIDAIGKEVYTYNAQISILF